MLSDVQKHSFGPLPLREIENINCPKRLGSGRLGGAYETRQLSDIVGLRCAQSNLRA